MNGRKPILKQAARWPALLCIVTLAVLLCLWVDSLFHLRRFIFLPGGDVGLGFRSVSGSIQWIEWAPWEPTGLIDFVRWSVPYWLVVTLLVVPLFFYLRHHAHDNSRNA